MKILITGAAGFIGSCLTDDLLLAGHQIVGLDNFDPFYKREIKEENIRAAMTNANFRFAEADIEDTEHLDRIFKENQFDLVIHLAAKAGVRPSIKDAPGFYNVNVNGTLNLLECCRKFEVNRFLFASTSSIYGNNKKVPFSENDPVDNPISPYASSKKAAELLLYVYYHLHNINSLLLRFFTVYGPRQRPDLAIHKFFTCVYNDEEIPLYGDGSTSRDYTYIDDIVAGIRKSMDKIDGYDIINLGGSEPVSLLEMVAAIEKVSSRKAKKKFLPMQAGDVNRTFADISKAGKILGYKPETDFETGLQRFKEWYEEKNKIN